MFTIQNTTADNALLTAKFACDLSRCKGACCTMPGGRGAPVEEREVDLVYDAIPYAKKYLSERNIAILEEQGAIEGAEEDRATVCIDNEECVFVFYENEIAKCAIERAYFNQEITFRKPLSCHLFPIRVSEALGGDHLRYERIPECKPAVARGERENITLLEFLRDPIILAFGRGFYEELLKKQQSNA